MAVDTLRHLHAHHRDFEEFAVLMRQSALTRFDPLFWGLWRQYVAPALPADGHVVDLGCGPGGFMPHLRREHPQVHITGVDVQPAMVREARKTAESLNAAVVEADLAGPLPLPDGCAHAAMLVMVLHELPWPVPLLREAFRILHPGGKLVVYDWVRQPLRDYLAGAEITDDLLQHFREHCLYTPDDLVHLAVLAGFAVDECTTRKGGRYAMMVLGKPLASA